MRLVGCALAAAGIVLAGCFFEQNPEQRARTVCEVYCECVVTAGQVEQCVTNQCLPVLPPVTDDCLDCVVQNANSCTALDARCTDLCIDPGQP